MRPLRLPMAVAFAVIANIGPAAAGTLTQPMLVSVTVPPNCSNFSVGGLSFGTVPSNQFPMGTATINVTCVNGVGYSVALDAGLHFDPNIAGGLRYMSDGAGHFDGYFLYQDANQQTQWGDANVTNSKPVESGFGTGLSQALTVYGSASAGQLAAGTYTDTVTATLTF